MKDLKHIRRFNESEENLNSEPRELGISDVSDSQKVYWDDFIQDLRRDMGSNTEIKNKDFRYLEKWLFDKILNKTVTGDEFWERPVNPRF